MAAPKSNALNSFAEFAKGFTAKAGTAVGRGAQEALNVAGVAAAEGIKIGGKLASDAIAIPASIPGEIFARSQQPPYLFYYVLVPLLAFMIVAPGGLLSVNLLRKPTKWFKGGLSAEECAALIPATAGVALPPAVAAERTKCARGITNGGYVTKRTIATHAVVYLIVYAWIAWALRKIATTAFRMEFPSPFGDVKP